MRFARWTFFLLATCACAQQPAIRVRLLTLYHLKEVAIVPTGESSVQWGDAGVGQRFIAPLNVRVTEESVSAAGRTSGKVVVSGRFNLTSAASRAMALHVPLEISAHEGELRVIGLFPVEDYVAAVLQGETAGEMPTEALKALAVAIRSYATRWRDRHKDEGFDFCDTTHCQYLRTDVSAAVEAAVEQTAGELLWDRGDALAAYYHRDCGGKTEDVAAIWPDQKSASLVSHDDPYCVRVTKGWKSEVSKADMEKVLADAGLKVPANWDRIVIQDRTASGRVRTLQFAVGDSQRRAAVSASSLRFALGRGLGWNTLKSDWYEVNGSGDHFVFTGRGTGHGIGLCQTGAAEMAREGKTYREILAFYYRESAIGRSAQGIPWKTTKDAEFDVRAVNESDVSAVSKAAKSALTWCKEKSGLSLKVRPTIDVFPTVAMFRNATGDPGWVAASAKGDHIRIEPPSVLKERLTGILRHEFLHLLIESEAKEDTPTWFREGLVLHLSGEKVTEAKGMSPGQMDDAIKARRSEAETRQAYAAAVEMVRRCDQKYGRAEMMKWLRGGLPADLGIVRTDKVAR